MLLRQKKRIEMLPGFTLIELLIVIVIIGILAGVLLTVIDPAKQQRKAKETVMRTTVEKGCLALHSCAGTTTSAFFCDSKPEVGIKIADGTPIGATYYLSKTTAADADAVATAATDTVYYEGKLTTGSDICRFECAYNFNTTTALPLSTASTGCLIGVQ